MKVYVVTQGEYSAYHIEKVFADRSKAEEYCEMFNKTEKDKTWADLMEIEEYDTADDTLETFRGGLKYIYQWDIKDGYIQGSAETAWVGFMRPDGQCEPTTEEEWFKNWATKVGDGTYYRTEKLFGVVYREIYVVLPAANAEKAFKIACDKWAELKAKEQGVI